MFAFTAVAKLQKRKSGSSRNPVIRPASDWQRRKNTLRFRLHRSIVSCRVQKTQRKVSCLMRFFSFRAPRALPCPDYSVCQDAESTHQDRRKASQTPPAMPFGRPSVPIPSPLAHFYAKFPLVTLPAPEEAYQQTPTKPKIWAYGPPPAGHSESLDPLCRAAQAYARFAFGGAETRWLDWDGKESSPEGRVPALHTPSGDLLTGDELDAWIASHLTDKKGRSEVPSVCVSSSVQKG